MKRRACVSILIVTGMLASTDAQSPPANLEGMWSDPVPTAADQFCFFSCTDAGLERLNALLDDPANDARPYNGLAGEAKAYEREQLRLRLSDAALKTYPLDNADDPGFLRCEPWGLARQMFAPHQLEIRRRGQDLLDLRYGEWDARRVVYMGGSRRSANQPPSPMGYSTGRWEGEILVIESSGIAANIAPWPEMLVSSANHSDQLRIVERYSRSKDGKLLLTATIDDPWGLKEPLVLKKVWRSAPEFHFEPYLNCHPATEFSREPSR